VSVSWPWALYALLAVPLLPAARWWFHRRRRRSAVTVSSVALIRAALPAAGRWRRRVPVVLFLAGLFALAVSAARPQATVMVPREDTSIVLAIDVSGSMCSTDVSPNRLAAAIGSARDFISRAPGGTRIGLVAFSGTAGLVVPPTTDRERLLEAVGKFRTALGTAIGEAILTSIDAIAEDNPRVAPRGVELASDATGGFEPDTIVVLTDGSNTTGVDPLVAASQAAARRLRVFTIGFGTTHPGPMVCDPGQITTGSAGRPDPGGAYGQSLAIDEASLVQVAETTGGRYLRAEDAGQLDEALGGLRREIGLHEQRTEITGWWLLGATVLILAALTLSQWWGRPATASRR
jgi:Ca-activated chloride channel family protein